MNIEIDGVSYKAGVVSLKREIEFYEKYRMTTEDGVRHREVGGVYKNYTLVIGNIDADTYDRLMDVLLSGKEYDIVRIPDGKSGFIEFKAMFDGISDELMTERNGIRHWDNLAVKFTAKEPIRSE